MTWIKFYEDKIERSKQKWRYTNDRLMPLEPRFRVICEQCFVNKLVEELECGKKLEDAVKTAIEYASDVSFKHRTVFSPSPNQFRIDMHFKCMRCDRVITFGVHVDGEYAKKIGFGTLHV